MPMPSVVHTSLRTSAPRRDQRIWCALIVILAREVVGFRARVYAARLWGSRIRWMFQNDERYFFQLQTTLESMARTQRLWHAFTVKGATVHTVQPPADRVRPLVVPGIGIFGHDRYVRSTLRRVGGA